MTVPDPIGLIIDLLQADATVATLTAGRVGREVPEADADLMPRTCVTVRPVGGSGRPGVLKIRWNRIDTACYGATLGESWSLHMAVREALETADRDGALMSVETSSDGVNARDPETQWPVCFASYRVLSTTAA